MISGFFTGLFVLFIYWVLWLLWCSVAPNLLTDQSEMIVRPKFWQFALVAIAISLMFKQK